MNLLNKREEIKAWGFVKVIYTKELVQEKNKQYIQETNSVLFLGIPVKSTTETRKPGLKDYTTLEKDLYQSQFRRGTYI